MRSIGLPELVILACVGITFLAFILYIVSLQRALSRCAPQSRTLSPGRVWLLLIPIVGVVWQFVVVIRIAQSLRNEFAVRGIPCREPMPARNVGLAMCVLFVGSAIPFLGLVAGLAAVVCWILHWVQVSGYSRRLAA